MRILSARSGPIPLTKFGFLTVWLLLAGFCGTAQADVYGFVDGAQLWLLNPAAEQQANFTLYSMGLGTRITAFDFLKGDFAVALPLRSGQVTERADPQALFTVKAEF